MPEALADLVARYLPVAVIFGVLLLSLSWHEAAHAWVADRLGDPTARSRGRVTLNPLKHLDPFLSLVLPLLMYFSFGWAFGGGKPVPVDVRYFKKPTRDFMFVALAGPGSNILLAVLFGALFVVGWRAGILTGGDLASVGRADLVTTPRLLPAESYDSTFELVLVSGIVINVILAFFNLVPVPPLDGSRVIGWALPRRLKRAWYSLDRVGILIVIALVYGLGGIEWFLGFVWSVLGEYDALLYALMKDGPPT